MSAVQDRVAAGPAADSVLLRHIAAQRARRAAEAGPAAAEPPPAPTARTPDRAVASAIARAAQRVHGLPLFFDRVTTGHAVVAEFSELLPENALLAVVQGAGDMLGAVAICPGLLTSLIEMQALGRISPRPAAARRPTRTDAAICVDFLDVCLAEIGAELAGHPGFEGMSGYRYASFLDDPRPLSLMLEDVGYRLVNVTLRAGPAGQRDGGMIFLLPAAPARPVAAIPAPTGGASAALTDALTGPPTVLPTDAPGVLAQSVQNVPIELIGILCRRSITLGELQALVPGDTISLPLGALAEATLETMTGQTLFKGRLGELAGRHALRIAGSRGAREGTSEGAAWGEAAGAVDAAEPEAALAPAGFEPPIADLGSLDPFRDAAAEAGEPLAEFNGFSGGGLAGDSTATLNWDESDLPDLAPMQMQIG